MTHALLGLLSCLAAQPGTPVAQPPTAPPPPPSPPAVVVGPAGERTTVATGQLVRPAGKTLEFNGRPVAIVASPDASRLYAKDNRGLVVIDAATWTVVQELKFSKSGGSMTGIAVSKDGSRVYATNAESTFAEATRGEDGKLSWTRQATIRPREGKNSYPCGIALDTNNPDLAYVAISRNNTLAAIELSTGTVLREMPVGTAPFEVRLSPDCSLAYVSNLGGRLPVAGEKAAESSGTPVVVDARGIVMSGTVSVVDLKGNAEIVQIETGLFPCDMALTPDGRTLYVANANSDTISVIDTSSRTVTRTLDVRPSVDLCFGSMPDGLTIDPGTNRLYVANSGNNAVGVFDLASNSTRAMGYIPAGWLPASMTMLGGDLVVGNIKGVGSRTPKEAGKLNSHWHRGSISRVASPSAQELKELTAQAIRDAQVPQALAAMERGTSEGPAVVIPTKPGEKSLIEHVFYVIKENRTYDQVFGAMGKGNGEPKLCVYGRDSTPNQHALAEQFVLLDNYYCNGVLSADGHQWATQGTTTPYLELSFGGFARSYDLGTDALTFAPSGFIWDHVLARGLSFRNYGEFDYPSIKPEASYKAIYDDFVAGESSFTFPQSIALESARKFASPDFPGWHLDIPDVLRAQRFIREFQKFDAAGTVPNFNIIYLCNDHTAGKDEDKPTPRSMVADNDLALGRIVEAISASKVWGKSLIIVNEDDPQDGFDHVDGHRSTCLVVSPYAKRGAIVSDFYNQSSVVHTIERIFGASPEAQLYALAPIMSTCFTSTPDLTAFKAVPNIVPLCEMNPKKKAAVDGKEAPLAFDFSKPDLADEDAFNRVLWHDAMGDDAPYPQEFAGSHGKGLAALGLKLDERVVKDEDDD